MYTHWPLVWVIVVVLAGAALLLIWNLIATAPPPAGKLPVRTLVETASSQPDKSPSVVSHAWCRDTPLHDIAAAGKLAECAELGLGANNLRDTGRTYCCQDPFGFSTRSIPCHEYRPVCGRLSSSRDDCESEAARGCRWIPASKTCEIDQSFDFAKTFREVSCPPITVS